MLIARARGECVEPLQVRPGSMSAPSTVRSSPPSQLPKPSEITADAVRQADAGEKTCGACALDKRFKWRLLESYRSNDPMACFEDLCDDEVWPELDKGCGLDRNKSKGASQARRKRVNVDLNEDTAKIRAEILHDDLVMRRAMDALSKRLDQRSMGDRAAAVVTGTTAVRYTLRTLNCSRRRIDDACPASADVDVDVRVDREEDHANVCAAVDAACADMANDTKLVRTIGKRVASADVRTCMANSCVYVPASKGTVRVDVPRLSDATPRIRFGHVSATRNDTLADGVILHRVRVTCMIADTRVSVPFVDIKTYVASSARTSVEQVDRHVRVPSARYLCVELSNLLTRKYDNVDASKDERRAFQLHLLERCIRKNVRDGLSRCLPPCPVRFERPAKQRARAEERSAEHRHVDHGKRRFADKSMANAKPM